VVNGGDSVAREGRQAPGTLRPGGTATYRLDLAYEGTAYRGWARQPGQPSVQRVLEEALFTVLRERVTLSVAGRTDAGVHAWGQVASFVCRRHEVQPRRLRLSLNALLPRDVAVTGVTAMPAGFVAREASARTYEYRLWVSPVRPVRERAFVWNLRGFVDEAALAAAARLLSGRRDFAALTPSAGLYHTCVRDVMAAEWRRVGDTPGDDGGWRHVGDAPGDGEWRFEITAGSFLHNMVRVAVGSMVDVAQGRMSLDELAAALESGQRRRMGQTAPARGLALVKVEYEEAAPLAAPRTRPA